MVVAGVAAALVLGFVYAYAIFYIPFNTLNAVIITHEFDSKGQVEKKEQAVIGGLLTPAQTLANLRAHWAAGGTPSTTQQPPSEAEGTPPPTE